MKAEPIGFAERLDTECERKRRAKDDASVFGLSCWKDEVAID